MKKMFLLISILMLALSGTAQYHFSFSHYTSDNGLSQNSITAVMKDHKGYMWFGTRDGLNRFDGYNFTLFNSKPDKKLSILSNRILTIKEDKWGSIWVKTYDEIIYRINQSTEELTRIEKGNGELLNDKIRDIYTFASGNVWLSTFDNSYYKIETTVRSIAKTPVRIGLLFKYVITVFVIIL